MMIGWLWLWLACAGSPGCEANTDCGFGEVCSQGGCAPSSCATSAQCPMEHHCVEGVCLAGCGATDDCYAGHLCESGRCMERPCEDTRLDCGYREFCDTTTGTCFDAGDSYCKPCNHASECGEGNVCWNRHCGVDCSNHECPAGFECFTFTDSAGAVVARQCLTYCWLYEDGWQN